MQAVEQAIFALLATDDTAGYQVVARSPGVCERTPSELAVWGPTHDSMLVVGPEAESLNFHPLPSGAHCVSLTVWVDWNGSGMGQSVSTRCLIVPPEMLARFGNNPFALVRAASANGAWQLVGMHGTRARSIGDRRRRGPGGSAVARAIGRRSRPREHGRAGAIGVRGDIPGRLRRALARATDRRAVQLSAAGVPAGVFVLDGSEVLAAAAVPHRGDLRRPCPTAVGRSLSQRRRVGVARERIAIGGAVGRLGTADRADVGRRPHRLPGRAGVETAIPPDAGRFAGLGPSIARGVGHLGAWRSREIIDAEPWQASPTRGQHAHAAHRQFGKSVEAVSTTPAAARSLRLRSASIPARPRFSKNSEQLDDLVYEAISGRSDTMEQLREAWPKIAAQLGEPLLAESLEQYLRYALSIWEECTDADGVRHPSRAIQALDVLCLLFGDAI